MPSPLVTIMTLNFRNPHAVIKCAHACLGQTIADRIEIIVIDNHSDDDSVGVLRNQLPKDDRIRIVEMPYNAGFGAGYNRGAQYAHGEFLFINNPAKLPDNDAIEILVQKMMADPTIGIIAPKLKHDDGTLRTSARSFPRPFDVIAKRTVLRSLCKKRMNRYLLLDQDPEQEQDVDWVIGGSFLIRREFFRELGGFDSEFFLFFEDTDMCRRCWAAGKRVVYCPSAVALDRKRRLSDGSVLSLFTNPVGRAHIRSGLRYFLKWGIRPVSLKNQ